MSRHIWDFHGGIHPPENKKQSSETSIRWAGLPERLVVPVQQHIGAPAKPCVNVGDPVLKGQKLAEAAGFVSLPVHAPTSGTVAAIELRPIQHPSGMDALCVEITPDGQDEWIEHQGVGDYETLGKQEILNRIRDAGIAGMGGAGFPSVVKLGVKPDQKIKTLILNAVECEPYITADDRLMRERADEIVQGLQIVAWLIEPEEILIGIEDNKPHAIAAMQKATAGTQCEVVVVPTKYPSGGEKQLIHLLTGKEVRSGGIPADVGVVCHNTGTAYAIKRAIMDGEPLISRITTLTGDCVAEKGNYEVLMGTPVGWLLQQAGVKATDLHRLIMGGPMMGFAVHNMAVPVVKTTNCLLVPNSKEFPDPVPEQPCIRCGSCAQVCPVNLLPQQLYWFAKTKEFDKAAHFNLADCIECGACSYVCPSNIPLVQYYRFAKGEIRTQQQEQAKADHARQRFEARQARLAREEEEKERKRQERAKAAAAKQAEKKAAPAAKAAPASAAGAVDEADALAKLQTAAASTMKRYKEAQKALLTAEKNGSEHLEALQKKVEQLKAKADAAKEAFTTAKNAQGQTADAKPKPAAASKDDPFAALKQASAEDFAAYKEAEKALAAAEASGAEDVAALQQRVTELKARSDASKAAMKEARAREKEQIQAKNAAADPVKAAKLEVAKQQVLLKKASKALQAAKDSDAGADDALESNVKAAEQALEAAEHALKKIEEEQA
ncbi:electron transport complex subunit RsxC [Ketobacter sp.]|uniref:electron transport complex subunit RsxC n=1 Tax=Ketobacter sp. TaxID=2083498 RepID=UPI000F280E46|nr:electron transport complex subunit RsxC [Ketobacter sp.]RLU01566.1 MAG: electron transport complex subunit RsxC [Ketobacter sp.]